MKNVTYHLLLLLMVLNSCLVLGETLTIEIDPLGRTEAVKTCDNVVCDFSS